MFAGAPGWSREREEDAVFALDYYAEHELWRLRSNATVSEMQHRIQWHVWQAERRRARQRSLLRRLGERLVDAGLWLQDVSGGSDGPAASDAQARRRRRTCTRSRGALVKRRRSASAWGCAERRRLPRARSTAPRRPAGRPLRLR